MSNTNLPSTTHETKADLADMDGSDVQEEFVADDTIDDEDILDDSLDSIDSFDDDDDIEIDDEDDDLLSDDDDEEIVNGLVLDDELDDE